MDHLAESLKVTLDIAKGYTVGRLIVDGEIVTLLLNDNSEIALDDRVHRIEVRNGSLYEAVIVETAIATKDKYQQPLYAGLYARVKKL